MRRGLLLALGMVAGWGCADRPTMVHGRGEHAGRITRPHLPLTGGPSEPMRAYTVTHGDPLWGKGGSALETPFMAPSTGRFGIITSPMIDGFRRIGDWKDD